MNRAILLVTCWLVIVHTQFWLNTDRVEAFSSAKTIHSRHLAQCFQDTELSEKLFVLRLQGGKDVAKLSEYLLSKARSAPSCRTQIVQGLIRDLEQASKQTTNKNGNYFLWENGASLLAEVKATEALDLLVTNIDLTDGWSTSINQYHFPALVAIIKIGPPAIPKLQTILTNDPITYRRKYAAFGIAYIGGEQARRALTSTLPSETDQCVANFLRVSLQAFDNKVNPNHISSALNGKWLSAFYCR